MNAIPIIASRIMITGMKRKRSILIPMKTMGIMRINATTTSKPMKKSLGFNMEGLLP
jgi:hypothetical protein